MSKAVDQAMETHREAMNFSEAAQIAQIKGGNESDVLSSFRKAFDLEKKAAMLLKDEETDLVTRAILFRSAAVLALDCGEYGEAEKLIGLGLSKDAPMQIADELRDLYEDANFERHMSLSGVTLLPEQIYASFTGHSVCPGLSEASPVISRISVLKDLFLRTAERLKEMPFRSGGRSPKFLENFGLYMSPPQSGSIAFTLQLGGSGIELDLGGKDSKSNIIQNTLECLDHFENDRTEELKKTIVDESYYKNFISLAEGIKPDGKKIKNIALATKDNRVRLRARQSMAEKAASANSDRKDKSSEKLKMAEGKFLYADATSESDLVIRIVPNGEGNKVKLHVPPEREDIVHNFWKKEVLVYWELQDKKKVLTNVELSVNE